MDLIWIIIILIAAIAGLSILLRFIGRTKRLIITGIIIVLIAGSAIYIYKDINDLKKNMIDAEKLFLLDIDGKIIAGFVSKGVENPITLNDVQNINKLYQEKNLKQIRDQYYKILIFKWPAFDEISEISDQEQTITNEEAKNALLSPNPKKLYVDKTAAVKGEKYRLFIQKEADKQYPTEDSFKGIVFGLFAAETGKRNLLIPEFKQGNIIIYPEKITLKIVKIFPQDLLEKFLPMQVSYKEE